MATAWPLAGDAPQPAIPVVGFLHGASYDLSRHLVRAFHQGLSETGYVEDRPVQRSTKAELFVNLATAKALGISIPQSILIRADEVIQ